jgi:putative transposase
MAGRVRIQYEGAVYHAMCRGDRREDIFRTAADRELLLSTLAEMCDRSGILVHSYVLMATTNIS